MDPFHFKVPFWKQLIEYFGAVNSELNPLDVILELEQNVVLFPGGQNEFLCTNQKLYSLDFEPEGLTTFLKSLDRSGYDIVCFGNVGFEDMVAVLIRIPYSLVNFSKTIPIAVPISYQRQYLSIAKPKKYDLSKLPLYLDLVKDCTKQLEYSLELQHDDLEKRYLLATLHKIRIAIQEKYFKRDGFIRRHGATAFEWITVKTTKYGKLLIKGMQSGPIIEEVEE